MPIPPHRMSPLKRHWLEIYSPLVEHMKLQVRMNVKTKTVELKVCAYNQGTRKKEPRKTDIITN